MKRSLAVLLIWGALSTAAETPQEAATTILNLLKERNYEALFQQRYSQWHRVKAEGGDAAITKLSAVWERDYDKALLLFQQLSTADYKLGKSERPRTGETGEIATATVSIDGEALPYQLFRMKSGLWGFQM